MEIEKLAEMIVRELSLEDIQEVIDAIRFRPNGLIQAILEIKKEKRR